MTIAEKGFITTLEPLRLKMLRRELGEMTVDELIELAQQAEGYLLDMTVHDPAHKKFSADRRKYWEYAWLLSCEADSFCPSDPHVQIRGFLVAYPFKQPCVDPGSFREWLQQRPEDVCEEFYPWLPVYLRPDEITSYAGRIYHKQRRVIGQLRNFEIMEIPVEE